MAFPPLTLVWGRREVAAGVTATLCPWVWERPYVGEASWAGD